MKELEKWSNFDQMPKIEFLTNFSDRYLKRMEIIWILENRFYFSIFATADTFFSGKRVRIAEKIDTDFWHAQKIGIPRRLGL